MYDRDKEKKANNYRFTSRFIVNYKQKIVGLVKNQQGQDNRFKHLRYYKTNLINFKNFNKNKIRMCHC